MARCGGGSSSNNNFLAVVGINGSMNRAASLSCDELLVVFGRRAKYMWAARHSSWALSNRLNAWRSHERKTSSEQDTFSL